MTRPHAASLLLSLTCALLVSMSHAAISPSELVAPKVETANGNLNFTIQPSVLGRNYQLQVSDTMAAGSWTNVGVVRSGDGGNLVISHPYESFGQRRFYRVALVEATPAPAGFSLISAGSFTMPCGVPQRHLPDRRQQHLLPGGPQFGPLETAGSYASPPPHLLQRTVTLPVSGVQKTHSISRRTPLI